MRPIAFTYTGTVGVPIDEVFELLTDPTRMPEWLPSCTAAVPGPKRRGKGDRHRLHFERQGRKTDAVIEVIEYERPTSYSWVEIIHRRVVLGSNNQASPRGRAAQLPVLDEIGRAHV